LNLFFLIQQNGFKTNKFTFDFYEIIKQINQGIPHLSSSKFIVTFLS